MDSLAEIGPLLEAIRTQPDDDAVRLVLSDWLEEHHDPDRAELIRLQCRRALLEDRWCGDAQQEPEYRDLQSREQDLLAARREEWLSGLPREGNLGDGVELRYQFRRGLIWVGLRLVAETYPPDALAGLEAMAELPAFAWVAEVVLDFGGNGNWGGPIQDAEEFNRILTHPAVRHVTCLDLDNQYRHSNDDGVDLGLLATRQDLSRLTEFTTQAPYQEGAWFNVEELWRSSALPDLRRVALGGPYRADQILLLAQSPHVPRLQALEVDNYGGDADPELVLQAFATSPHFPDFRRMVVRGGRATPFDLFALLRSPHLPQLEFVDCELADFDDHWNRRTGVRGGYDRIYADRPAFVRALVAAPEAARLRKLRLREMELGDEDVEALVTSPHLAELAHLDVSGNHLSEAAVDRLRQRFPTVLAGFQQPTT